jgi:hypothetical protein
VDAAIAPGEALGGQADDQGPEAPRGWPSTERARVVVPVAGDQLAAPAQHDGRGGEQPDASGCGSSRVSAAIRARPASFASAVECGVGARRAGAAGPRSRSPSRCPAGPGARASPGVWRTSGDQPQRHREISGLPSAAELQVSGREPSCGHPDRPDRVDGAREREHSTVYVAGAGPVDDLTIRAGRRRRVPAVLLSPSRRAMSVRPAI